MAAQHAADWESELEQEFDGELAVDLPRESEFEVERESPGLRPLIRSICGEARRIRSRLLTAQGGLRGRVIVYARKWLSRTASRWPSERLRELTRRELDIFAGCLYGIASAMGEEPQAYRRLRSDIGRLLRVPAGELEDEAALENVLGPRRDDLADPEIFPPDGRTLVRDTLPVPFRFVCCLEVTFVNPLDSNQMIFERGTGTLISDRHVLTAAHVVVEDMSQRDTQFPVRYIQAQILVAPARNDRDLPFGFSDVTTVRVAPGWQTAATQTATTGAHVNGPPHSDFALLTLATAMGRQGPVQTSMQLPAPQLGFWSSPDRGQGTRIRPIDLSKLRGQPLNLAGYPIDKCRRSALSGACQGTIPGEPDFHDRGSTQWVSTDRCVDPAPADMPAMITYMADSAQGQSGGPVWLNWQGFRNLVAINTGGYPRPTTPFDIIANMGVRITEPVLRQLRAWMRADGVSATF